MNENILGTGLFEGIPDGTESLELFEDEHRRFHPRLGPVRALSQGEFGQRRASRVRMHPRLGPIRLLAESGTDSIGEREEGEILGTDQRVLLRQTTAAPIRWVCHLELKFPGFEAKGTGALITPRHILTCAHNLYDDVSKQEVRQVIAAPGRINSSAAGAPFGTATSARVHYPSAWRTSRNQEFDFGLITLQQSIGDTTHASLGGGKLGYWENPGQGTRISAVAPAALQGQAVETAGYPGDKCGSQPSVGSASPTQMNACPWSQVASTPWFARGRITNPSPAGAARLMLYDLDTYAGQSGSPVWLRSRNLVAIHTGPGWTVSGEPRGRSNRGVRITDELLREVRRWMGGGTVTPSGPRPILRRGSKGAAVVDLQRRLNAWIAGATSLGLRPLVTDGDFGPRTLAAVIAFQRAKRLSPDGIVGPLTWSALQSI